VLGNVNIIVTERCDRLAGEWIPFIHRPDLFRQERYPI